MTEGTLEEKLKELGKVVKGVVLPEEDKTPQTVEEEKRHKEEMRKKSFERLLAESDERVQKRFYDLYLTRKNKLAEENQGKPSEITLDEMEILFLQAKGTGMYDDVDAVEMAKNWKKYGEPMGGAKND